MRIPFNDKWIFKRLGDEISFPVTLPHDAMFAEKRTDSSAGGKGAAWFEGYDYIYEKNFSAPKDYENQSVMLEFEGVYRNAEVYLNDELLSTRKGGYIGFYVDVTGRLKERDNCLRVIAHNADMPNSRWYSGAGIYRPVWLHVLPKEHILLDGVRIETTDYEKRKVCVTVLTNAAGEVVAQIMGIKQQAFSQGEIKFDFCLPDAELWSEQTPNLYVCSVTFGGDTRQITFGIRLLSWNKTSGFTVNGKREILRGACIHHDNGLIGACCYPEAEERKIQILKECGYNAIRSAHNPCSKALLDACDRLGMYVLDEYTDMWYIHKNTYDDASHFEEVWRDDLTAMVQKDFNHPCVVMYSIGNEVNETAFKRGISLTDEMTKYLHMQDISRPVTCGINVMLNWLSKFSGENPKLKADARKKKKSKGSEFFNRLAGIFSSRGMLFAAKMRVCDRRSKDAFAKLDIAGYNYGISRYKKDLKKYADRLILGTETFVRDAAWFMREAKRNNRILGDFVWAGIDYLGEVGIGAWEYEEYAPDFNYGAGWIAAGSGVIDLTGQQTAQSEYTRVAFGLEQNPVIAVVPVNHTKEPHTVSAWRLSNAIRSWAWNGYEGRAAYVEIYSSAHSVALYINGKLVSKKKVGKNCTVNFKTKYRAGKIEAVSYDASGNETGRSFLVSANDKTVLQIVPERETVQKGKLCYIRLRFTDENGILKPVVRDTVEVNVQGGMLLGLGNACPYNEQGYLKDKTQTYYGEALAIILAEESALTVTAKSRFGSSSINLYTI